MADIVSSLSKIQVEEADFNSPVSEALNTKFGANINALIDFITDGWTLFTTNGTYTTGANETRVELLGMGGGAGGGRDTLANGVASAGGVGCNLVFATAVVTASTGYSVTIGAGGLGATTGTETFGAAGGNTTFGSLATFYGAPSYFSFGSSVAGLDISYSHMVGVPAREDLGFVYSGVFYNNGGGSIATQSGGGSAVCSAGSRSIYAAGGTTAASRGGGGGAGFGAGGNGGTTGTPATVGGIGAGGGAGQGAGASGANGGSGMLLVRPG